MPDGEKLGDRLERWLAGDESKTIGDLIDVFEEKSFAVLFVLLLSIPALPLPTGGVTHVFEVIAMLLALELIVGRRKVWLPQRWRQQEIGVETRIPKAEGGIWRDVDGGGIEVFGEMS